MEIGRKKVAVQALSTFLVLLGSSCLAARGMEYGGGPSPSPAALESDASFIRAACERTYKKELCYESLSPYAPDINSDPRSLCSRASWLALQGLENVSQALSDLKGRLAGIVPRPMPDVIDGCDEGVASAETFIWKAVKEGPKQPRDDQRTEPANRYNIAMSEARICALLDPIGHDVKAAHDAAVFLISNARDLCP